MSNWDDEPRDWVQKLLTSIKLGLLAVIMNTASSIRGYDDSVGLYPHITGENCTPKATMAGGIITIVITTLAQKVLQHPSKARISNMKKLIALATAGFCITAVIATFERASANEIIKANMDKYISTHMEGSIWTKEIAALQTKLQCCGGDNHQQYGSLPTFQDGMVPRSCCRTQSTGCGQPPHDKIYNRGCSGPLTAAIRDALWPCATAAIIQAIWMATLWLTVAFLGPLTTQGQ